MKIKYPTKKQRERLADKFRLQLQSELIGSGIKCDIEQSYCDFLEGIETAINHIKLINQNELNPPIKSKANHSNFDK